MQAEGGAAGWIVNVSAHSQEPPHPRQPIQQDWIETGRLVGPSQPRAEALTPCWILERR